MVGRIGEFVNISQIWFYGLVFVKFVNFFELTYYKRDPLCLQKSTILCSIGSYLGWGLGEEIMIQCDSSSSSIKPGNKKDSRASEL